MSTNVILFLVYLFSAILVCVLVFPFVFLKKHFTLKKPIDTPLRVIKGREDEAIVYLPNELTQKYIKEYVISNKNGHTSIRCLLQKDVKYISYRIACVAKGKVFTELSVEEDVIEPELTKELDLPDATEYVAIVVDKVNKTKINKKPKISRKINIGLSILYTLCSDGAIGFCLWNVYYYGVKAFSDVFYQDLLANAAITVTVWVIIGVLLVLNTLFIIKVLRKLVK